MHAWALAFHLLRSSEPERRRPGPLFGVQDAVAARGALLDRTEKVLDHSLANAKISATKAKEQYKR